MSTYKSEFLNEMHWRGQIHQTTGLEALDAHLCDPENHPRLGYVGFDPTADSLTIGNLVGIMTLARLQRAGHIPVAVMGGGTGLIGDPSGKTAERQLRSKDEIEENVREIRSLFERFLDLSPKTKRAGMVLNNLEWLGNLSFLDALRDIGKHFSVNMMIQKDSVRERLHNRDQGISYTEFSYMLLQSYDFCHLWRTNGVTMQFGGSDQWGNIVAGADLIRRTAAMQEPRAIQLSREVIPGLVAPGQDMIAEVEEVDADTFGLTWPLVTKADGTKFGKTETGAIWLTARRGDTDISPARTSPYAYYQFWLNAADADVIGFLKAYTHLSREEVGAIEAVHAADPGKREAQRALARHATALLHGETERDHAEAAAKALFSGDLAGLSAKTLGEVFEAVASSTHSRETLEGEGVPLADVLALTTLATSKSQARQHLAEGSVTVNGLKATAETRLTKSDLLHGNVIALRRGKKSWYVTRWE